MSQTFRVSEEDRRWTEALLSRMVINHDRLRSFGEHAAGVVARTDKGLFIVNPTDLGVSLELLVHGVYEPAVQDALTPLISAGGTVLVLGAHVGAHVVPLSRLCRRLIAIEANPLTCEYLRANVALNGCRNVEVVEVAASDRRETLQFLLSRANSGGSKRMPLNVRLDDVYDGPEVVDVEAFPLDELIGDRSFELVLVDIEGSEVLAFLGMREILAGTDALCVEFLPDHVVNVAGADSDAFAAAIPSHLDRMCVLEGDIVASGATEIRDRLRFLASNSSGGLFMLLFTRSDA